MKYEKIDRKNSKINAEKEELDELADLYVKAESMPEFMVKASISSFGKSKFMKWFRLFYFLRNNSIYDLFLWCPFIWGMILTGAVTWLALCMIPTETVGLCWKTGITLSIAAVGIGGTLFSVRHTASMLEKVKSAVWKRE